MEFLERSRPPEDAVLILHATFTRLAVGEPHFTQEAIWAAAPPNVEVLSVVTNGELALVSLCIAVDPEWPVELAVIYTKLMYMKGISVQMFGEELAMTSPATYVACPLVKAQWQGTQDWEFVRLIESKPEPEPLLN